MPVQVPPGTPGLGTLEQDKNAVLEAVRGGYSAAFNLLAPLVGVEGICGDDAAREIFPSADTDDNKIPPGDLDAYFLKTKVHVPGESILEHESFNKETTTRLGGFPGVGVSSQHKLLSTLPGFQGGRLQYLSKGLRLGTSLCSSSYNRYTDS